jgi:hypothetical protein
MHTRRRLPRMRTVAIPVLGALATLMVCASAAHAADIPPAGIGDLMPSPSMPTPKGGKTFYEQYSNPLIWSLDSDYGITDVIDPALESVADICMALIAAVGSAAVVMVEWFFNLVSIPELQNAMTKAIGGASKGLTQTLLPSAIAVGGFIAFLNHKNARGSGLSQIGWVIVSGILSVSLLTSPGAWVGAVDTGRQLGSNIAMNATANGIGDGNQKFPMSSKHAPKYTDNSRDTMLRKSSDAVWRTYVATPWCIANFGSIEVCKKYGTDILDKGIDFDGERLDYMQDNLTEKSVGLDSKHWKEGHNPVGRIMITVPGLFAVIVFCAQLLILALASLASLLGALMLLVAGVLFACMWVIPGRPRQWGLRWFDQLLGFTLQSAIVTLVLGCTMILQTVITTLIPTLGYLPAAGLSIAGAIVAVKFRKIMESIVGVTGGGMGAGGAVMGLLAAKAASKAAGFIGRQATKSKPFLGYTGQPPRRPRSQSTPDASPQQPGGGGGFPFSGAGIPRRPNSPLPAESRARDLPAEPAPAGALTSGPDAAPSITITRPRSAADGPPSRRSVPAGNTRARTALPAGTTASPTPLPAPPATGQSLPAGKAAPALPAGKPSPTLRPEQTGVAPRFRFRKAPRPGATTPRVIEGKVIRSRPAGRPDAPSRPRATSGKSRRAPRVPSARGER